jgi:hypothetical protein
MSLREWTAIVQLVGGAVILGWLLIDFTSAAAVSTPADIAWRLIWAVGAIIAFNIVALILVHIAVAIARGGEEMRDEPADERDLAIAARSGQLGYVVVSSLAALALVPLALGVDPVLVVYALFLAPLLGGLVHAASQLVLYRIG